MIRGTKNAAHCSSSDVTMLHGSNANLSTHQLCLISLTAAVTGGCVGYSLCKWITGAKAQATQRAHYIKDVQLDSPESKQTDADVTSGRKADPYDPLPRQGYVPALQ